MKKIKTATLTFHASHNYGSMLQAYALQQMLQKELGVENEIINFRSDAQKKMYQLASEKKENWKKRLVNLLLGNHTKALTKKYQKFEKFLNEYLILSKEFNSEAEVAEYANQFNYLISGSDQIWNTNCIDFAWPYFLPFAKNNAIAYAPSMGPNGKDRVSKENYSQINDCLQQYKAISVREQGTADVIKSISNKDVEILIDPTLMINKEIWDNLSGQEPLIKGEYIFMYKPAVNDLICKISNDISKQTGLPVIVSNKMSIGNEIRNTFSFNRRMHYKFDIGPIEFLNLLKNAKYVISGSFHAVVFSIIFNKPFLAVAGKTDNRMSQLLKSTDLLEFGVDSKNYMQVFKKLPEIDFTKSALYIEKEREHSLSFMKKALNL